MSVESSSRAHGNLRTVLLSILYGLLIGMIAANIWPIFLRGLSMPLAAIAELIFLGAYVWWAAGGGPPRSWVAARANAFRYTRLTPAQWGWGLLAAVFFALTVHAAIVLLFRFIPYPVATFRKGYDISFVPTVPLRWLACVISALSAGLCEEVGFRGYMQRPIEQRVGVKTAIFISSLLFMLLHLSKSWAGLGMMPIIFGAGVLLGLMAGSSHSLIPSVIGHTIMDIGLFAFWWTGTAGSFTARPIAETGVDRLFFLSCAAFVASLFLVLLAIAKLRRIWIPAAS
jgi:membrane protease YdiL (CAAX protease family)